MIYVQFKLAELISLPYFCIMWHIYLHCALCICLNLMLKLDKWNWTIFCNKACRQMTWGASCETIETQISSAQWIQDMMSLVGFCLQLKNILMRLVVISYACYLLRMQLGLCTLFSILASELPISIQKKKKEKRVSWNCSYLCGHLKAQLTAGSLLSNFESVIWLLNFIFKQDWHTPRPVQSKHRKVLGRGRDISGWGRDIPYHLCVVCKGFRTIKVGRVCSFGNRLFS